MNNHSSTSRMLGAVAALGAATVATQADAAIVYVDLSSAPITVPNNIDGVYLNFATGLSSTTGAANAGWDFNPYASATNTLSFFSNATAATLSQYVGSGTGTTGVPTRLTLGMLIDGSQTFAAAGVASGANAFRTTTGVGYVGVRFINETTGATNFGWVALNITSAGGLPGAQILGYAYENTGLGITAGNTGVVPEPTTVVSLGMLAAGALGLRQWRRRKAA